MTEGRPPIPEPTMREVRQRCGFGCVVCGMPLYEYDHLKGWANVKEHVAEDITLLCDQHHKERTNGLLPTEEVIAGNQHPFNLREGVSRPYDLHYSGDECSVEIGGNLFTVQDRGTGTLLVPVVIDGFFPVAFVLDEGHLLLNVTLVNEANDVVLVIRSNELVYSMEPWDIELKKWNFVLRAGPRDIFVDLTFGAPNSIKFNRGRLLWNGVEILVAPGYVWLSNNQSLLIGNQAHGSFGLVLGNAEVPGPCAFRMSGIRRYLGPSPNQSHAAARKRLREAELERQAMDAQRMEFERRLNPNPSEDDGPAAGTDPQ